MSDALVSQLARALNLPPDAARHTLHHLVAALRDQLDTSGEARVPGLGTFHSDEAGLSFEPDAGLARAVNHRYAGLRPIEAGPSSSRRAPKPSDEPHDPFADATTEEHDDYEDALAAPDAEDSAEDAGATEEPETAVGFQPLESFITPEDAVDEPEEAEDEFAPEPTDSFEQADLESLPEEPFVEEQLAEEPSFESEEPAEEDEAVGEGSNIDELLAGTWTEGTEDSDEEHVLGALPPDDVEDADYALVEPHEDELDEDDWEEEKLAGLDFGTEPDVMEPGEDDEAAPPAAADWAEATADKGWEDAEDTDLASGEAELEDTAAPPMPTEPPPLVTDTPEEAVDEQPPIAPPASDRPPAEPAPRRGAPVFLTVLGIAVVLGVVALFWLLNREPETPNVAQRVPADTATVAQVPSPAADTLGAAVPADTVAVAEPPAEPEPPPSADPLRSTAGIDPAAGGFTWVVASELDRAVAQRRVAAYREQGLRADVVAQEAGGRTRYRVSLGQFGSISEAEARRADLPADVPSDSWILRL